MKKRAVNICVLSKQSAKSGSVTHHGSRDGSRQLRNRGRPHRLPGPETAIVQQQERRKERVQRSQSIGILSNTHTGSNPPHLAQEGQPCCAHLIQEGVEEGGDGQRELRPEPGTGKTILVSFTLRTPKVFSHYTF